jgi:hypothetical protein
MISIKQLVPRRRTQASLNLIVRRNMRYFSLCARVNGLGIASFPFCSSLRSRRSPTNSWSRFRRSRFGAIGFPTASSTQVAKL